MGVYGVTFNPGVMKKDFNVIDSRSEPYSGNPTVRDRRGATGNVVHRNECARLLSTRPKEKP